MIQQSDPHVLYRSRCLALMLCALKHMIIPLFPYLAWWLIPWLSTLIFPTVWWLDGLGWYTSPVCRLTPILLMISIWVRCPFCQPDTFIIVVLVPLWLPLDVIILGGCVLLEWCGYSLNCDLFVRLFAFPFITEVTWYLVWCFLHFLDAETSDSTLSRLIVCVHPLALYTRHPLHVPLGLLDPRILGSFP